MEITFRQEKKQKSVPFLQKFKDKINKVDRFSGLIGALGLRSLHHSRDKVQTRLKTETKQSLSRVLLKQRKQYSQNILKNRTTNITVNHFNPSIQPQGNEKENKDRNAMNQLNTNKSKQLKIGFNLRNSSEQEEKHKLKEIILPKINGIAEHAESQQQSEISQKMKKRYSKFAMIRLEKKNKLVGAPLR